VILRGGSHISYTIFHTYMKYGVRNQTFLPTRLATSAGDGLILVEFKDLF